MFFPRHRALSQKTTHSKGVILIGKLPAPDEVRAILELAEKLQWPVCADVLSNARCFPTKEQIRYFDWIEKPKPEFILHFGERMTSKKILQWLLQIRADSLHVSPWPTLQDPNRLLVHRVQSDIPEFCQSFEAPTDPSWLKMWKDEEPIFEEKGVFTEVHAMRAISQSLPADFGVFLGSGMPIRDGDHFLFPKRCRGFFGNRGVSGIDGNIATIAGLAEEMPILGIIGDQATLYDLNSLPCIKKTKYPVVLLISNNFGGGMFHHLPIAASPHFEQFWAASHTFRFALAAQMFDLPYLAFDQMEQAFTLGKSAVVELITDRKINHQYQQQCSLAKC
jgi:2-succinyl-5-enolpyruvyl-6-hydroxy-3-cyclohexene-1-carboxylate synthase